MQACRHPYSVSVHRVLLPHRKFRPHLQRPAAATPAPSNDPLARPVQAIQVVENCCIIACIVTTGILLLQQQQQQQQQLNQTPDAASAAAVSLGDACVQADTRAHAEETLARPSQHAHVAEQLPAFTLLPAYTLWSSCMTLQGALLLTAFVCSRAVSFLTNRGSRAAPAQHTSADAAARLARLEALVSEQQQQLQAAAQRYDKAAVRFKLYNSQIKSPLQQAQASLSQQAQVLTQLSAAQEQLKQQMDQDQQLLGALHQVSSKQFQVTFQAINKLQEQHSDMTQAMVLLGKAVSTNTADARVASRQPPMHNSRANPVTELQPVEDPWLASTDKLPASFSR